MSDSDLQRAAQSLQRGAVDEAHAALAAILAQQPNDADALNLMGVTLAQRGDDAAAARALDRAVKLRPQHPSIRVNHGNLMRKLHRLDEAAESFRIAVAMRPDGPNAYRLGAVLVDLGRHQDAIDVLNHAARLRPEHGATYLARARAARGLGNDPAALFDVENVLKLEPENVEALLLRATVKRLMGEREAALEDCDRALAVDANNWAALNNRGVILDELGRSDEALRSFERSLELNPDNAETFLNMGTALVGLTRAEEAIRRYDDALARDHSDITAHVAKGVVLFLTRRFDEALQNFDRAVAARPQSTIANHYRAFPLLAKGMLREGFEAYEWRRRGARPIIELPRFPQDELKPGEDVRGKRVLVYSEQGLGDAIQYARFARVLADRGAAVVLATYPPLTRLMSSLGADIAVIPPEGPAPTFDITCPLLSLPYVLGTTIETIPPAPYLSASEMLRDAWRERLGWTQRLRVGLAWSGNPHYGSDAARSLALAQLGPLLAAPGVELVSLQKGVRGSDEDALAKSGMREFRTELSDFAETAALIAELDLVVAVDTSVAHLAGAMGKPVWILLPVASDWRWFDGRDDSPWYASVRLFRQRQSGDWTPVLAEAAARLAALVRERSAQ